MITTYFFNIIVGKWFSHSKRFRVRKLLSMGSFLMERIFRSTPNRVLTAHTEWLLGMRLRHSVLAFWVRKTTQHGFFFLKERIFRSIVGNHKDVTTSLLSKCTCMALLTVVKPPRKLSFRKSATPYTLVFYFNSTVVTFVPDVRSCWSHELFEYGLRHWSYSCYSIHCTL